MRISIHNKITLVFAVITAVVLIGIYTYLKYHLEEETYASVRKNLHRQLSLAKSFIEASCGREPGIANVKDITSEIKNDLGLRVTVIAVDGKVMGDSELADSELSGAENHLYRQEVQQALSAGVGESRRFSTTLRKDMLYAAAVFGREGRPKGIIRLAMPLVEIENISEHLRKFLVISFLAAFFLIFIAGYAASLFISRPLVEMSYVAGRVAEGDFSHKINIRPGDEVGDLAKAFTNMTEQVKARMDEVTSMRSRLEAVLLSMFDGIMVVDPSGNILLMNGPLKELLMVRPPVEGKKPLEVIRNIEVQEIVEKALNLKGGLESREISVILESERTLLVHATAVRRGDRTEGAVLVFHDITDLRALESVRRDFVANVSHELRTPIASIKGYAETLQEGALDDGENARDFVKIISSEADRLASLVNDLLDLSRIESGRVEPRLKPCDVAEVVDRALSSFANASDSSGIKLATDIKAGLPRMMVDEGMITQVLYNLLDNAIKYNRPGGNVTVSARQKGDHVEIEISDTGVGIPEEDMPRIFERFYRVDKARSREMGGTGLGLSIVKHIVQAHGGEVSVSSVLGKGSTFTFTIPKA